MNGEITAGGADDAARAVTKGLQDMGDAGRAAGKDIDGGMKKAADSAKTLAQQLREVNAILRENAAGMKLESLYQVKQAPSSTYQPDLSVFEKADADREAAAKAADDKAAQERSDKARRDANDAHMADWTQRVRQSANQYTADSRGGVGEFIQGLGAAGIALKAFKSTVEAVSLSVQKPMAASEKLDAQDVRAAKAGAALHLSPTDVREYLTREGTRTTVEERVGMLEKLAETSRTRSGGLMPIRKGDAQIAMEAYMATGEAGIGDAAGSQIARGNMKAAIEMELARRIGRQYGQRATTEEYNRAIGENAIGAQQTSGGVSDYGRSSMEKEAARNGRPKRLAYAASQEATAGTNIGYAAEAIGVRGVADTIGAGVGASNYAPQAAGPSDVAQLNATIRERMPLTAPASRRGAGIEGDRR